MGIDNSVRYLADFMEGDLSYYIVSFTISKEVVRLAFLRESEVADFLLKNKAWKEKKLKNLKIQEATLSIEYDEEIPVAYMADYYNRIERLRKENFPNFDKIRNKYEYNTIFDDMIKGGDNGKI